MADRFFAAGLELACTAGVYCTDTHVQMLFTEEEIRQALRWAPDQVTIGSGLDQCTIVSRRPEDRSCQRLSAVALARRSRRNGSRLLWRATPRSR